MSEINKTPIDIAKGIDAIMSMHNLIEYSDNYSKTSGSVFCLFFYGNEQSHNKHKNKSHLVP